MKNSEKILFFRRLALYLNSGVPIVQAISFIITDSKLTSTKQTLLTIERTISSGLPLSAGLSKFPKHFDAFCIGFVYIGEISGNLSETLERLAIALHKREALRRKVLSALAYPGLIFFGTICITVFLTFFIFPKILPVLRSFRTTLPVTTQVLIFLNDFIKRSWIEVVLVVCLMSAAAVFGMKFKKIIRRVERLSFRIPLFSDLLTFYVMAIFSRTLSLQLRGGVRILPALELVRITVPGICYAEAIVTIEHTITQGQRFSLALRQLPDLFPSIVYQMIGAGEETGTLNENLEALADLYEENLEELAKVLTTLIEPVLLVCMGFAVGFVALAIITPIYALTQNLSVK
jgi:type II secretory pathway component PulF